MKKDLLFAIFWLIAGWVGAQVNILESEGWLESAYVKWEPQDNADKYHVYYSGEEITDKQIDDQLIRSYGAYFRADVLGLKAGSYTIKVVPVIGDEEGTAATTSSLTVKALDRTGFAFNNGTVPGGYKADGTLKNGAVVLYITEKTKNTVSLDVTGATTNPCVGLQVILDGFKKGKDNRPLVLRMVGQITDLDFMYKGDIVIENSNNAAGYITLEGVGDDAVADGWGIRVKNASNIEIKNIATMNCNSDEGDNIGLQQANDYVWVHHCDFFYGDAGSDSDQAKGDGALDSKKSGYVTISYNHFWDTGKSNLLGNGTEDPEYLTYHHNWYDHSDSRHPRIRSHSVHVYNNYYDGNSKYGIGATNASSVLVEANYFRNCKYPILTSMQGSDVYDESAKANDYSDMPTFSKEDGGSIKAFNNYMVGHRRFVAYGDSNFPNSTVDFDAYVLTAREEQMPSTVKSSSGGNTHNNFDINSAVMYTYTAETPENAKKSVMLSAGRMFGGDFEWTFNNAVDDISYDVNTGLKSALKSYKTSLVAIQGDGNGSGEVDPGDPNNNGSNGGDGGNGEPVDSTETGGSTITADIIHNFTESGKTSTHFNITGKLSDSKGTVNYGGLTLTECLKIESSTLISFTTTEEATLTLVFNEGFAEDIKIDGISHTATNGVLSLTIAAGTHEITKDNIANLYLISIEYAESPGGGNGEPNDSTATVLGNEPIVFELKVYPNPFTDYLIIESADEVKSVEVFTLSGKLVKHFEGKDTQLSMSDLTQGTYFVKVRTSKGVVNRLVVRE